MQQGFKSVHLDQQGLIGHKEEYALIMSYTVLQATFTLQGHFLFRQCGTMLTSSALISKPVCDNGAHTLLSVLLSLIKER